MTAVRRRIICIKFHISEADTQLSSCEAMHICFNRINANFNEEIRGIFDNDNVGFVGLSQFELQAFASIKLVVYGAHGASKHSRMGHIEHYVVSMRSRNDSMRIE